MPSIFRIGVLRGRHQPSPHGVVNNLGKIASELGLPKDKTVIMTYNHTTLANETLCFVVIYHVRRLVRIDEHDVKGRLELGQRLRSGPHK